MTAKKRIIRQRMWQGDKADAQSVGENLRDIQSYVSDTIPMRTIDFSQYVYTPDGVSFASDTQPLGVLNIYTQALDGSTAAVGVMGDWKYDGRTARVKFSSFVPGTRYALIRILVIG